MNHVINSICRKPVLHHFHGSRNSVEFFIKNQGRPAKFAQFMCQLRAVAGGVLPYSESCAKSLVQHHCTEYACQASTSEKPLWKHWLQGTTFSAEAIAQQLCWCQQSSTAGSEVVVSASNLPGLGADFAVPASRLHILTASRKE